MDVDKETVFSAPSSADPYAESLARFFSVFGYQVTDEGKALLSSYRDWGKAIGLELMAAFGPMALTLLFEMLLGSHSAPLPASSDGRVFVESGPAMPLVQSPVYGETRTDDPAPFPPSGRKRTPSQRARKESSASCNVIQFRQKVNDKVHAMVQAGKTHREIAASLGIGKRTVGRIVATSKSRQVAALEDATMAAS